MGDWAARLASYAGSDSLRDELGWWQGQLGDVRRELPCDHPQGGNLHCHAHTLAIGLDVEQTRQLLQQAPAAYHTQVNDLLLTALAAEPAPAARRGRCSAGRLDQAHQGATAPGAA